MHDPDLTDERVRESLARDLIPLVHEVATRIGRRVPNHVLAEDLVAAGMEGLADALGRYDAAREASFRAFAEMRIRGAIMDELRRRDVMSRKARAKLRRVEAAERALERRLGRPATGDEVANVLGLTLSEYHVLRGALDRRRPVAADLGEIPARQPTVSTQVATREAHAILHRVMASAPPRTREVLRLYYFEDLTLREIAERLDLSLSRVCQIRKEAERRLRGTFERAARRSIGVETGGAAAARAART